MMDEDWVTAAARVCAMRDDMLFMVEAFNNVGEYERAFEAQAIVIALNKFENDHDITQIAWPPRRDPDDPSDLARPPERS